MTDTPRTDTEPTFDSDGWSGNESIVAGAPSSQEDSELTPDQEIDDRDARAPGNFV